MKKFFTLLIVTILLLISGLNLKAQTLQNIPCTGYNADVVANGAGTGSSTNADVDGVAWVFVANDFAPSGTVCSTTNCWPSNNKVTSLISPNPVFTLQAPTVNNSLRLAGTNSGTLTLPTHVAATNLYFLATGGSGACTFSDTIFFTDGTFQVNTGLSAADWCSASSPATAVFYRIQTTNYASCTGGTCQYMYQSTVAIAAGNQSKLISSIKFNNTGAVLNVFAVAGTVFAPCAAPASAPTAINLVPGPSISITGSFTASTAFPAVDHYLILRSTSATPPNQPVNGTTYTVGDVSLGATVVAYQTTTTISDAGPLTANTQYYYYIYSTYGTCTGTGTAPYYNTTPLTGSATTLLPMSGIYTIDNTQPTAGTNFNTFTAAVNTLNSIGIGGPVTFNVTAGQTFPITCSTTAGSNYGIKVTTSGTAANPIIFQKYGSGTNPVLSVSGSSGLTNDVGVWLSAVSYITFDGIDVTDPAATKYLDLGYYLTGAATVGCTYNTIKNCNVTLSNVSTNTNPTAIYMTSAATSATGRNIYNKFYNNTISNSFWGYKFVGVTGFYDVRNEIGNVNGGRSVVKNLGYAGAITAHGLDMAFQDSLQFFNTLIDSLRSTNGSPYLAGVHFPSACSNYNIYGDTIQNLIGTENYGINLAGALTGVNYVHNVIVRNFWATGGNISMFRHAAAESGTLYFYNNVFTNINTTGGGIEGFYTNSAGTYYVYNNQFYNINSTFTSLVEAIFVASTSVDYIYNNYISDLNCPAGTAATTSCNGIQIGSTTTAKVYYNTVYLKYTSTASTNASICLYAVATPTNLDMRNNIFVNKCDMTIGTRAVAFMWPSATYTAIASTTNNNIYYAMGNPYNKNFLFYNGTTAYSTLAAYKAAAVTFDQQSYSEDVPFLNTTTKPYNLRINPALATYAESGGSVIATPAITTDFDGNLRPGNGSNYTGTGSAPDIGASEFDDVPYWAPCVAPANPPTNLSVTGSTNTAIINFNASSTTTPNVGAAADHYLILRSTSATAPINTPVNGTLYLAKDITSFQSDGDTVLAYIECNTGTQVYLDSFNLHLSTQYYYYIYAANSICQTTPQYNTTPLIVNMGTACPAPTAAATTLILTSPSATHLSGSFTASASADHYLIYRSTSSTFSAVLPSNGVTYAIGSILGSGTTADTLVAYQTGVTFTDPATLIPTLQYYYYVIAANSSCLSGVPAYYTSTILSGGSYPTPCVAPINQPVSLVLTPGALSISGSFTAPTTGAPDHYLIVRSGSSNPTPPINGVNYTTVGQVITGAGSNDTVVAYQTTTSFTASSLISGVTYYFYVYAANSTNCAGPLYLLTSPLTGVATPALTANTSWVCPAGVTSVSVQAWGAGGAGGNLTTANSGALRCGGGGGGAYASGILTVTPNTSYSVVIGAAGVGNSGNTVAQATGGNTIFGSNLVVAAGGAGVGANTTAGASGGLATACTGNLVNRNGGNGGTSSGSYAGAGGGAGGTTAVGGNGGTYTTTGAGGASNPSSGTGGAGKYASTGGAGTAGSNYGGAGGGAGRSTGTTTYAGGAGTPGYAIISINPTAVPTSIALIPASTSITGSFTGANYATNYLIVKNTTGVAPTATPVNGTTYSSGTPLTGSTFVSYVSSTSFTDASLTPNVHYYYYIYTAKALPLSGGYVYVTTPLTGDVTTACAAPTAQPTALNFTPGATSMSATFTASASADNYLIVRSTSSSLSASPVVGTTYSAGTLLGGGTVISYQSSNSFTDNGPLTAGVLYYYYIFAANSTCTSGLVSYLTTSPLTGNTYTLCIAPTNQPTALNLTPTALTVSGAFTASVGGADHYLVIRSTSNTLSANPVNGTSYTAGTSLGGGTVVAYQTGITYNDINLIANTNYYYYIFAANSTICSGGPTYLNTTPLVNNTTTLCGIPAAQPTVLTLNPSTYSVSGSFIASLSTDNYLILRSTSSTFSSALPVNGTTYLPGDILGGLDTVVAFQPGTTFNDIQLNSSTIYYYFVFATNATCAGGPIYLTNAPLTTYVSTLSNVPCVAPANAPSALSLVPAATSMGISFTAAAGGADFYLLIRSLSSTLSATPANGTNYATGASLGGGTVISHQLGLTYTDNALSSGNLYYYYIYSYNAVCVDGPIYSASYLTGSSYTTCVAPTAQPTLLTFTPAVSSVSGIFTASASADHYLIVRSTASTLSATPVALTTYTAGTSLGGGTVVAYQTGTTFNDNGPLTTATLYYYFVFASNNICVNGPLYKTTTPLTSSTYTLCPAPANQPTNLAITASGSTASGSFIASTGSPAADHYLIVRNTTGILPTIPSNGVTYSSGIQLTGSTFIAYQTTTTLSDATLSAGTTYFYYIYAANSNNCSGGPIYATAAPIIGNVVPSSATTLTTSGSYTVPTGVTSITVYAFGGGGGGGGGYGSCSYDGNGGGGGGGGSAQSILTVSPGQVYTVTVGAAGAAGAAAAAGGAGGASSFTGNGANVTATGGSAGSIYNCTAVTATAPGGTGTNGQILYTGGTGSAASDGTSTASITGTGGGGAGSGGNGTSPASTCGVSASGGSGTYPGGAGGYNTSCGVMSGSANGPNGALPGGGGAGAMCYTGSPTGGAGGAGEVIIVTNLPCATPANQPTSLVLTPAVTSIAGSFSVSLGSPTADHYLIVRSASSNPTLPLNGTTYTAGQVITGTGTSNDTVVAYQAGTFWTDNNLNAVTPYYYYIFAANSNGSGTTPLYLATSPLNGTTTTICPIAPTATITPATQTVCYTGTTTPIAVTLTGGASGATYYVNSPLTTTAPANTFVLGTSTPSYTGSWLQLTSNNTSQYGAFIVQNPNSYNSSAFTADYDMNIYPTGGADGLSFNYGGDLPSTYAGLVAANGGATEKGITATGLAIHFETYGTNYIQAFYNGVVITSSTYSIQISQASGTFVHATVSVNSSNQLTVIFNGTTVINALNLATVAPAYVTANKSSWMFGIATRSGGVAEGCNIKNAVISMPSQPYLYSFDGGSTYHASNSYTPPATAGTYQVYFEYPSGACPVYGGTATVLSDSTRFTATSLASQTQCLNGTFTPITVAAAGNGTITYQWYKNNVANTTSGTSLGAANGAQTNSYTPQATANGTLYYYCVIHSSCGVDKTSPISGGFNVNPVLQPTALVLTPGATTVAGSFAASQGADSYLVLRSTASTYGSTLPLNGTTYTSGNIIGTDTVVAYTTNTSFIDSTLNSGTIYYYYVFAVNASCTMTYLTTTPLSNYTITTSTVPCITPAYAPTNLSLVPGTTTMAGSFTAAAGGADYYLIIRSTSSSLSSTPVNGTIYNTGSTFDASGDKVVAYQLSSITSFSDIGLNTGSNYYYYVYSVNVICANGPFYSATSLDGSMYTNCVTPLLQPTALNFITTPTTIGGTFTASVTADHYLIVRSTTSTLSANPSNISVYTAGDILGGGTIVAYQTGTSFTDNGSLVAGTLYYYHVFSTNSTCSNGPLYLTSNPLVSSTSIQCVAPINQSATLTLNTTSMTTISGTFPASVGGADHYLIVRNTTGATPSSPINGTTYSNGTPLNGSTFVAYQPSTTFADASLAANTLYHYFVYAANSSVCSQGPAYVNAFPDTSSISIVPLSGIYTIGGPIGSRNYATFAAAKVDLVQFGVQGAVTFDVASGTYSEQLDIPAISGASATNTITFQSASGNNTDVTLIFAPTSTNNYVVRFNGATYVTVKSMTITATGATYANAIVYTNSTHNVNLSYCIITGVNAANDATPFPLATIVTINGYTYTNIVIDHNIINNGSYSLFFIPSTASTTNTGISITHNTINGAPAANQKCVQLGYIDGFDFGYNNITVPIGSSAHTMWVDYLSGLWKIHNNKILNLGTGIGFSGWTSISGTGVGSEALFYNNSIYSAGTGWGTDLCSVTYVKFMFNTFVSNSIGGTFNLGSYYGTWTNDIFKNNLFYNSGTGNIISIAAASNSHTYPVNLTMNYNNYYNNSSTNFACANNGSNYTTFASFQSAASQEANGISVNANFVNILLGPELVYANNQLKGKGTPYNGTTNSPVITTDIYGTTRLNPPSIGAYEVFNPCATPYGPAYITFGAYGPDPLPITTTNSITATYWEVSSQADHYLVVRSTANTLSSLPVNGTTYTPGTLLGGGKVVAFQLDDNTDGPLTFVDNGLTQGTHYYYYIFSAYANGCDNGPIYLTTDITNNVLTFDAYTNCSAPVAQPTVLNLIPGGTTVTGSFTAANGTPDNYLVVRNTTGVAPTPVNGTVYTANEALGDGFVVAYQSGTTISDAGLLGNTLYHYFVFSENSNNCTNGPVYLATTPLTASVTTNCAAPIAQPTDIMLAPGTTTVTGSFIASTSADHYLIVRNTTGIAPTPINGSTYSLTNLLAGSDFIAYQTDVTVNDLGLNPGIQYYYYVFAANSNCNAGPIYLPLLPLTVNVTTLLPQTRTLKVTAMLQEYFNTTTGLMNQTLGIDWISGDLFKNFPGTIVDTVRVLIRKTNINADVVSSFPIDTVFYGVNLNNNGLITISLSAGITGYHYIEIKHRNSIETWSDSVDFSTDTVKYDFYNHISQFALDNGMLQDGTHAWIWGGDVNQNGNLESEDATIIYVAANSDDPTVNNGYVICDIDGNGNLDSQDYGLAYNNANTGANIINPFSYLKKK